MKRELRFAPPALLKPHEETIDMRLNDVIDLLLREQAWTRPICIEADSLCIMDGHHRRLAAIHLGLAVVPVIAFTYGEVRLGSWIKDAQYDAEEIVERARCGRLLAPKSTRHVFPPFTATPTPLTALVSPSRPASPSRADGAVREDLLPRKNVFMDINP